MRYYKTSILGIWLILLSVYWYYAKDNKGITIFIELKYNSQSVRVEVEGYRKGYINMINCNIIF